jgi:LysM repeat protein
MGSVRRASWNKYLIYLGLNVAVSAVTVLLVLSIWDRRDRTPATTATPTIDVLAQVASAIPTVTSTIQPSPTPVTYMIRAGDTLSDIAVKLGVSIDALMDANDLTDPNALSAGQVLIVPVYEDSETEPPSSSRTTDEPQATGTLEPIDQAPGVVIHGVEGAEALETESIRLLNPGGEVSMAGWTLDDGEGHQYIFPAFTFYTTGAVYIHTRAGKDTSIDLYWGLDEPVWAPGKVITLRNVSGAIISTFQIPES